LTVKAEEFLQFFLEAAVEVPFKFFNKISYTLASGHLLKHQLSQLVLEFAGLGVEMFSEARKCNEQSSVVCLDGALHTR